LSLHPALRFAGKTPKLGNAPGECEDDYCTTSSSFAIADGASEGSFSHLWAGILVRSFCSGAHSQPGSSDGFVAWVEGCRAQWSVWESQLTTKELPWFTREKLRQGAFATFLGISVVQSRWRAVGCGDACLFIVRDDVLAEALPILESSAFNNTPTLLSTSGPLPEEKFFSREGELQAGDVIYLTTDALSCWFLAECERGEKPWIAFEGISSQDDLELFVSEARLSGALRNDDVTLVTLSAHD
jgi:hypothetical protein